MDVVSQTLADVTSPNAHASRKCEVENPILPLSYSLIYSRYRLIITVIRENPNARTTERQSVGPEDMHFVDPLGAAGSHA